MGKWLELCAFASPFSAALSYFIANCCTVHIDCLLVLVDPCCFDPTLIRCCTFSGLVRIGRLEKGVLYGTVSRNVEVLQQFPVGIRFSSIDNSDIGDCVAIEHVTNLLLLHKRQCHDSSHSTVTRPHITLVCVHAPHPQMLTSSTLLICVH